MTTKSCGIHLRASFALVKLSTLQLEDVWGAAFAMEHLMMKSSTLFECGPLHLYVMSVPRPSPFYAALLFPCIRLKQTEK